MCRRGMQSGFVGLDLAARVRPQTCEDREAPDLLRGGVTPLEARIDSLSNRTQRARLWLGLHNHGQVRTSHGEHMAILDALEAHQPDRARLLMAHHLLVVEDYVQDQPTLEDDQ